jgi:hypothetical protein
MNLIIELDIQYRRNKLLEDEVDNLKFQLLERDREIERLNHFLSQQSKQENEYYTDYYQGSDDFDSTDHLVDDSNDVDLGI